MTTTNASKVEALVNDNYDLVKVVCLRYCQILDYGDIESEVNESLYIAACKFVENEKSGEFRGYAFIAMRNRLLDFRSHEIAVNSACSINTPVGKNKDTPLDEMLEDNYNPFEAIDTIDSLKHFFTHVCNEHEKHIVAAEVALYNSPCKFTQSNVCTFLKRMFGEEHKQSCLSKRIEKMNQKFRAFLRACDKGDKFDIS